MLGEGEVRETGGNFRGEGDVHYLYYGDGFTGIHKCQNLPNYTLFICIVYCTSTKLFFSKTHGVSQEIGFALGSKEKGFFLKILFISRQKRREGEREGEKHHCVAASHAPPTGDPAGNPGMSPNQELNQQPPSSQAGAQSTEPHQPGQETFYIFVVVAVTQLYTVVNVHQIVYLKSVFFVACNIPQGN